VEQGVVRLWNTILPGKQQHKRGYLIISPFQAMARALSCQVLNGLSMLRNYFLIAWRNFKRHKGFSFINVLGLSIGMAACLLILQYVTFQTSFDDFHAHAPRLYRMVLGKDVPGRWVPPHGLAPLLRQEFPQVEQVSRMEPKSGVVGVGKAFFSEDKMYWVDPSFLTMFSFPLQKGDPASALSQPLTVVISPAIARKYFGDADPMGKTLTLDGEATLRVTGVLEEVPSYSHLQFDFLLSYVSLDREYQQKDWGSRGIPTYVLLREGANPRVLEHALPRVVKRHTSDTKDYGSFWLQPLQDIHLSTEIQEGSNVDPKMLYFLLLLALFILVIAWINYINLSTARATERAREVGVRKAMGANRPQLLRQFMLESVLLNALAILLAFTLVQLSLPSFRELTGLALSLTLWQAPLFWVGLATLFILGTVLSGLYPALVLSAFHPVTVLKGSGTGSSWRRGMGLRQVLVVFQFTACIVLMAGTAAVYLQTEYMRNQDLGINIEHTLVLEGPPIAGDSATRATRWQVFKQALQQMGTVRSVTASSALPSKSFNSWSYTSLVGAPPAADTKPHTYAIMSVDANFFGTLELRLLAGRIFSDQFATDQETVILNEEAARKLGFTNPAQAIGRQIDLGQKRTIIGVIKNYHHDGLKNDYFQTLFLLDPTPSNYFSLKIATGNQPARQIAQTLAAVEKQWKRIYPGNPFSYFFLNESFDAQYRADQQLGRTVALFAFLTILVACLGLFGLASFTTAQRTKEIGIRKALGASLSSILLLLSKDYVKLVLLASLLALPLAYWSINKWLENYAFDFHVSPWLFILPAAAVLVVALLTVSYRTLKAARQNPVEALRYE
jgi:putative ABC transport system permease protein